MKLHQPRTRADENRAKNERAQDAVKKNAVLINIRDGEISEDHHEDENIVHRQSLFDDVAGQILQPDGGRRRFGVKTGNG